MKKNPGKVILIVCTVCVLIINLLNLVEYVETGDKGSPVSNICFIAGAICIVIGWVQFFVEKKKRE